MAPTLSTHAMVSALSRDINKLDALFPGNYRFGPRAVVGALMALSARCLVDSYEEALDFVHHHWGADMGWEQAPAKSGLTRAREALGVGPMREFWREQLSRANEVVQPQCLHGLPEDRRFIGIDGSWMLLPESEAVRRRWAQVGRPCTTSPQALLVAGVEITQRLPVAATVVGLDTGERQAALSLTQDLQPKDVLLFDRGYPGRGFLAGIIDADFDFIIRMVVGEGGFPEVNDFWKSQADEAVIKVTLPDREPVLMRAIRRRFPRGRPHGSQGREKMVLLTTLLNEDRYDHDTIVELYRRRWEAETFFREAKTHMQIESFHSNAPDGILQEMYATLAWMALFATMEARADQALESLRGPQQWDDPKRYQINRAQLARLVRRNINDMFSSVPAEKLRAAHALANGIMLLAQRAVKRRPDRHFERKRKSPWGRFRNDGKK